MRLSFRCKCHNVVWILFEFSTHSDQIHIFTQNEVLQRSPPLNIIGSEDNLSFLLNRIKGNWANVGKAVIILILELKAIMVY